MMIPSMHADLADDPVTSELVMEVEKLGIKSTGDKKMRVKEKLLHTTRLLQDLHTM